MKYELKREISQDDARDAEVANSYKEAAGQAAQKSASREAVEQLAAALELLNIRLSACTTPVIFL